MTRDCAANPFDAAGTASNDDPAHPVNICRNVRREDPWRYGLFTLSTGCLGTPALLVELGRFLFEPFEDLEGLAALLRQPEPAAQAGHHIVVGGCPRVLDDGLVQRIDRRLDIATAFLGSCLLEPSGILLFSLHSFEGAPKGWSGCISVKLQEPSFAL